MPVHRSTRVAILIEPDESTNSESEAVELTKDVVEMAHELLALCGKGRLPGGGTPLVRPETFVPIRKRKQPSCLPLLAAISDDEADTCGMGSEKQRRIESIKNDSTNTDTKIRQNGFLESNASLNIPVGRPLAAPPRLPRLAPGEVIPPAMYYQHNKRT